MSSIKRAATLNCIRDAIKEAYENQKVDEISLNQRFGRPEVAAQKLSNDVPRDQLQRSMRKILRIRIACFAVALVSVVAIATVYTTALVHVYRTNRGYYVETLERIDAIPTTENIIQEDA